MVFVNEEVSTRGIAKRRRKTIKEICLKSSWKTEKEIAKIPQNCIMKVKDMFKRSYARCNAGGMGNMTEFLAAGPAIASLEAFLYGMKMICILILNIMSHTGND
jgi:hypothetical protein